MEHEPVTSEQDAPKTYQERPLWQVWGARVLLIIFIFLVMAYYVNIARGGI